MNNKDRQKKKGEIYSTMAYIYAGVLGDGGVKLS